LKKSILQTTCFIALIVVLFFSCTKEENPAPIIPPTINTPVGSTLTLNTWKTTRGTNAENINVLTQKSLQFASSSNTRAYRFVAYVDQGTPQAKTASLSLAFNDTVNAPATGSYTLVGLPNSAPGANQVFITHSGTSLSGTFFSIQNGGVINVTNFGGVISFVGNNLLGSDAPPSTNLSMNLQY